MSILAFDITAARLFRVRFLSGGRLKDGPDLRMTQAIFLSMLKDRAAPARAAQTPTALTEFGSKLVANSAHCASFADSSGS